jgi:prevent-host-death family protein
VSSGPGEQCVSVSEMRERLAECLDRIDTTRFVVQRHGEPRAYLISVRELMALEETIAILEQRDLVAQLRGSLADLREGRMQDARDAFTELDAEFRDEE